MKTIIVRKQKEINTEELDFEGIQIILNPENIKDIKKSVDFMQEMGNIDCVEMDVGDFRFVTSEEDEPLETTTESNFRWKFYNLIIFKGGGIYPKLSNEDGEQCVEFEPLDLKDFDVLEDSKKPANCIESFEENICDTCVFYNHEFVTKVTTRKPKFYCSLGYWEERF